MALWVLEVSVGNHLAVRRREINQAVTINAPRANCNFDPQMSCKHVHGTGLSVPVPCDNQHDSCGNTVHCVLKVLRLLICIERWESTAMTVRFTVVPLSWALATRDEIGTHAASYLPVLSTTLLRQRW